MWDNFFPILIPKDSKSLNSLEIGLQEAGEKRSLNGVNLACSCTSTYFVPFTRKDKKKVKKTIVLRDDFIPFPSKNVQIWDRFFPMFFPKYFKCLKSLEIRLWEMGAKKRFKWSEQSVTYTQTNIRTLGLIDWINLLY